MSHKYVVGMGFAVVLVACASEEAVPRDSTAQALVAGDACAHAICATGTALDAACDPCATKLCAQDAYCCSTAWDTTCVGEVTAICGQSCSAPPPTPPDAGTTACEHALCASGGPLALLCDVCATTLCALDPYCCSTAWDATCVGEVTGICGKSCN